MRYVRYHHAEEDRWGILVKEDLIQPLDAEPYCDGQPRGNPLPLHAVKLLAPCLPSKIVAIGKNYQDHIDEMYEKEKPETPILFFMPSTALLRPEGTLHLPPTDLTKRVDYEGELALVIKKEAQAVSPQEAPDYVLGYTCLNDITARDLQKQDGQWTRAKGMDHFAPVGPVLTDEVDPNHLRLRTRLNGKIVQESSTDKMLFGVYELISFISHYVTLLPGDVVSTGTPAGVGPMKAGDKVEVSIEGIGVLRTHIAAPRQANAD